MTEHQHHDMKTGNKQSSVKLLVVSNVKLHIKYRLHHFNPQAFARVKSGTEPDAGMQPILEFTQHHLSLTFGGTVPVSPVLFFFHLFVLLLQSVYLMQAFTPGVNEILLWCLGFHGTVTRTPLLISAWAWCSCRAADCLNCKHKHAAVWLKLKSDSFEGSVCSKWTRSKATLFRTVLKSHIERWAEKPAVITSSRPGAAHYLISLQKLSHVPLLSCRYVSLCHHCQRTFLFFFFLENWLFENCSLF